MAKDKKQKLVEENKEDNKDKELTNRLIGLVLVVFSAISLSNIGTIPKFIGYIFAYLFGSLYGVVLLFVMFIGVFMLFAKKQFNLLKTSQYFLILGIFISILILCSTGYDFLFTNFVSKFNSQIDTTKNSIDFDLFAQGAYGGGIIGALFVGVLNSLFSQIGTLIIAILLLIGFIGILTYPLFVKFMKIIKKIQEKRKVKIERLKKEKELEEKQQTQKQDSTSKINIKHDVRRDFSKFDIFDDLDKKKVTDNSIDIDFEGTVEIPNVDEALNQSKPKSIYQFDDLTDDTVAKIETTVKLTSNPTYTYPANVTNKPEAFVNKEAKVSEVEPFIAEEKIKEEKKENLYVDVNYNDYRLPPIYLLKDIIDQGMGEQNRQVALEKAEILNSKFRELKIDARVENFVVGPAVTQYEIKLEPGVRVNTFISLQEDFKLALGSSSLRLETPIPGKTAIGIEVPNAYRTSVSLKEVLQTLPDKKEKLYVAVGKDIAGQAISVPIVDMPHTLISGATNSGKSVCVNTIIVSLLMNYKPNEVQLIMVDLKRVELLFYVDIPHLMCPIITEADHVTVMLEKLHKRMMDRFDIFAQAGVKNIGAYNQKQISANQPKMSFIILIIDEFAELIMSKKTENVGKWIQKITQLGRAAGIHLILSTQRPSSNIIEGDIKNNISGRMTFRLSSNVDSKVVIDVGGAEKLLNNGDMLLAAPFLSGLRRIQGVYCSDDEIEQVVSYAKSQASPHYDPDFIDLRTEEEIKFENNNKYIVGNNKSDFDALYEDIKTFVIENKKASTSLIQRRFQIGYNKAANYMDRLEFDKIVGPENASKPREVLIDSLDDLENN